MNTMNVKEATDKLFDKNFRQRLMRDEPDLSAVVELGYQLNSNTEVRVVIPKKNMYYVAMPPIANLESISAGVVYNVGTSGTIGTVGTTFSSAGTFSSFKV